MAGERGKVVNDQLTKRPTVAREERPEGSPDDPEIGKWYWVKSADDDDDSEWFGCVTRVGSNYVKLKGPHSHQSSYAVRIHFDEFWKRCRFEPDHKAAIQEKVDGHRAEFNRLMGKIKQISARLGVAQTGELMDGDHTQALSVRTGEPIPKYRESLAKAKDEELPELFKEMKDRSEKMAAWMQAETYSLEGQQEMLEGTLGNIGRRILAVDLYAGLSEEAVMVRDGEPAEMSEPVRLFQRRHYMDEESLANYKAGGMDYKSIGDFDDWIAQSENMERILPLPRCVVAFQVRRHAKERRADSLAGFIRIAYEMQADKSTFLYVRNGDQLWRISTAIDFGEKLFPDVDEMVLYGQQKLWMNTRWRSVDSIITDVQYQAIVEKDKAKLKEWKRKMAQHRADKKAGKEVRPGGPWHWKPEPDAKNYVKFNDESVYYDDAAKKISARLEKHNRVATVIQGMLDRSPVLSPHPPWQIWTNDGFREALRLVYDLDKALVGGEAPDFEVYRRKLNRTLKDGSVTIGQERAWLLRGAKKENARRDRNWRSSEREVDEFAPYGDPGPGELARVVKYHPRSKACTYRWNRDRRGYSYDKYGHMRQDPIACNLKCPTSMVMNVDAYTPGDYKIFFDDPRTREDYLKWARWLLTAEDYHAGKKRVGDGYR